jgi:acyl carrier protein
MDEFFACARRNDVDQATVLEKMKTFFADRYEPEALEGFADKPAKDLLEESIDVVEMIVYLEDELGSRIDTNRIGPALANMTFGQLAAELARLLNEGSHAKS